MKVNHESLTVSSEPSSVHNVRVKTHVVRSRKHIADQFSILLFEHELDSWIQFFPHLLKCLNKWKECEYVGKTKRLVPRVGHGLGTGTAGLLWSQSWHGSGHQKLGTQLFEVSKSKRTIVEEGLNNNIPKLKSNNKSIGSFTRTMNRLHMLHEFPLKWF